MMSRPFRSIDVHEATRWAQMRLSTMSDEALNQGEREMETGSCLGGQNTTGSLTPTSLSHTLAHYKHTHTHTRALQTQSLSFYLKDALFLALSRSFTQTELTEFHRRYSGVKSFCLIIGRL